MREPRGEGRQAPRGPAPSVRWIVWGAFLYAAVFYGVWGFLVARPMEGEAAVPRGLFPALGILLGAAALLAPRFLPGTPAGRDREGRRRRTAGIPPRQLVGWALDESVAVVGLVAALVGGDPKLALPYVVAGAALLVLHRPKG